MSSNSRLNYTIPDELTAPSKESTGGFYIIIIEVESMNEAVEWAKRGRFRPVANEVRELRDD